MSESFRLTAQIKLHVAMITMRMRLLDNRCLVRDRGLVDSLRDTMAVRVVLSWSRNNLTSDWAAMLNFFILVIVMVIFSWNEAWLAVVNV